MRTTGTKDKILSEGRALLQRHGYNGFSFQHIADHLGIKKPSLYDHYASKDDLIIAILENYSGQFSRWTDSLITLPPLERIMKAFFVFHSFVSDQRKVCPVLSLAADYQSLSRDIQKAMNAFVDRWLDWLSKQIAEGQDSGEIRQDFSPQDLAQFVYNLGMGSQFQARIKGTPELPLKSGKQIIHFLKK